MSLDRSGQFRKKVHSPLKQSNLIVNNETPKIKHVSPKNKMEASINESPKCSIKSGKSFGRPPRPKEEGRIDFGKVYPSSHNSKRLLDYAIHPEWFSEKIYSPRYSIDSQLNIRNKNSDNNNSNSNKNSTAPGGHKGRVENLMHRSCIIPTIKRSFSAPPHHLKNHVNPVTWQDWWG